MLEEQCRLVAVLGMGGIGKTSLTAKLAEEVASSFARVYWRSLRDATPISDWLAGAIGFLSDQQRVPPPAESERIAALLQLLRERRCFLSWIIAKPCSSQANARGAIGQAWPATGACCRSSTTSRETSSGASN